MAVGRLLLLLLPALAACVRPTSQETYTFEDCELKDYGCPRLLTLVCARDRLESRADRTCTVDSDCVELFPRNDCGGMYSCYDAIVSQRGRADLQTKLEAEFNRYCAEKTCGSAGSCLDEGEVPGCSNGRCVFKLPDGGS